MKISSRLVLLLVLICVQCVISWNPLRGYPCPQVTDLFKLENDPTTNTERFWPPGAQALLQKELEKLWYLPTGKLIITADFRAALATAGEDPVILLGRPGHWEAVMRVR
ncbi:MAG: hypothetical protein LBE99_02455 [Puniceicoccales bacterium]|jgi:hypothetical protein|nr:hypothetical protein [Puniceicoccales bacterium]